MKALRTLLEGLLWLSVTASTKSSAFRQVKLHTYGGLMEGDGMQREEERREFTTIGFHPAQKYTSAQHGIPLPYEVDDENDDYEVAERANVVLDFSRRCILL